MKKLSFPVRAGDFDRIVERRGTGSLKWDSLANRPGSEDFLPMWVADMDFEAPQAVTEAILERALHPVYGYTLRPDSYYEALLGWLERRFSWKVEREWVLHTPGVVPALVASVLSFTRPGDKVVLQPPVYYPFYSVILNHGRRVVENPLRLVGNRYEPDIEGLKSCLDSRTRLLLLCSPHNPVGRVWSPAELRRVVEVCRERDVVIVSDEIHCDLVMPGHAHTPIASLSEEAAASTVTCTSPGKTFNLTGLNSADIIVADPRLRGQLQQTIRDLWINPGNVFAIAATEAAYTSGEAWLEELLVYLRGNYEFLTGFLAEHLPEVRPIPLEGTYLAWLDFRKLGLSDSQLRYLLWNKARVFLDHGPMFGRGGEGFQRLNIACPRSRLEDGLRRIAAVLGRGMRITSPA